MKDEREWRLIYAPDNETDYDPKLIEEAKLFYRTSELYFTPYLKIDVARKLDVEENQPEVKKLVFETIIAGPALNIRRARASFYSYAYRNGYLGFNVGVEPSKVTLR